MHRYASTEAGIVAADWVAGDPGEDGLLPVGRPMPGIEVSLDGGELVVRGPHLARGEWRGGAVVPGRLAPDTERPGWRAYRTGDMFRFDGEGMLRFTGRADRQVKINGVRVELAEIEAALRRHPDVTEAAVLAIGPAEAPQLHGFVASAAPAAELHAALIEALASSLPPAMRPVRLFIRGRLPTLPNGKIDLRALAAAEPAS
jgi:acyl-coenzyme A synthetase/AMP-(fatty) acid ligase